MLFTGAKIKPTLTILQTNLEVFQVSYLQLSHFFSKVKKRFLRDGITNLLEKVTTISSSFTEYTEFFCR